MRRCKYSVLSAMLTLALGSAASAADTSKMQPTVGFSLDGDGVIDFCDTRTNADGLFQIRADEEVCVSSGLQGSANSPKEKVALAAMASSFLSVNRSRMTKPLPLPLLVLGSMVADAVTTNLEARHASPELPLPSPLAARDFPSNFIEPVNWAAIGLARAQAAGSCEAVTVSLFKKLARDVNLTAVQRTEAGQILRAFGIANLHPDDRCL